MSARIYLPSLALLVLTGCGSFPKAAPFSGDPVLARDPGRRIVYLPVCEASLPAEEMQACDAQLRLLLAALRETRLFRAVKVGEAPVGEGNLFFDFRGLDRRFRRKTPADNPGFVFASLVIPFWWTEPRGFHFEVVELPDGVPRVVDTRWEATAVMWSLSSLINIFPGRTFEPASRQDVGRLRDALVGR